MEEGSSRIHTVRATNFKLKCTSPESITYVVELDQSQIIQLTGKDYALPLCGPSAKTFFTFSGFQNLLILDELPSRAELTRRLSQHMDSVYEMEEVRRLVQPLVDAFKTNYGRTFVQEYYGIDYTKNPEIPRTCYILAELREGLPLDELISKEILHDHTLVRFMKHVLEGLQFLHKNQIIHRDIKAANVIVSKDRKTLKIIGLTMAVHLTSAPRSVLEMAAGTVPFISPEMAELSATSHTHTFRIDCSTDIWSAGCLMIQLLQTGQAPYFVKGPNDPVIKPTEFRTFQDMDRYFKMNYRPQYPNSRTCGHGCVGMDCRLLTNEIVQFLNSSLEFDPQKRLNASDLLLTPYFHPFYIPLKKSSQQQRFVVETFQLGTADEAEAEYLKPTAAVLAQPGIIFIEQPGEAQKQLEEIRKKIVLPEILKGDIPPGCVYIIRPDRDNPKSNRQDMLNKHKVFELLLTELHKETDHVFRHVAVPPMTETPLELRVFTETEADYELLSDTIKSLTNLSMHVADFTAQILKGLTILHQHGIIHKDIRCSNILAKKTGKGHVPQLLKIAHFGKASYHSGDSTLGYFINYPEGSSRFASKEMQKLLSFDLDAEPDLVGTATDVFSLGCTVIEMFTRSVPRWRTGHNGANANSTGENYYEFTKEDADLRTFLDNLLNLLKYKAVPDVDEDIFSNCPDKKHASEFVQACFIMPSKNRPTCQRLLLHPFIQNATSL